MISSECSERYNALLGMVAAGSRPIPPPPPRTEVEEDRLALECLILEHDEAEALERYRLVGAGR